MNSKHTVKELSEMQSLPLDAKIEMSKQRIKQWVDAWKRYEIYLLNHFNASIKALDTLLDRTIKRVNKTPNSKASDVIDLFQK